MQSPTSLTLKNVSLERAERSLCEGFCLTIQASEAVRVVGENGAGKSSLLKAILGLIRLREGDIEYCSNHHMLSREEMLKQTLYIGHSAGLKPTLTVEESLRYYAPSASSAQIKSALGIFALAEFVHSPIKKLSAGQVRKVALCRLCLSQKTLWLLDEPYTALDIQAIEALENLMQQHLINGGILLLTSHQAPVSFKPRQVELS
ncbi:heme ABC exporter ATP-binding protein CcmA [Marinomonas sp.]